ncbi:tetratricopeptide repeat protein [Nonomuraea sp. NPDC050790]|uniref:tetratricopeptide repeat protein n=1 Tax=Nonomuraea sp. NPDC050790 TaxID=3364371 RepID=UPI0037BC6BC1
MTDRLLHAALSAYERGDYHRVAEHCREGLASQAPDDPLLVRLSHLQITATELWWATTPCDGIRAQVEAAVEAAARTGDPELQALAGISAGAYRLAAEGLPAGVACFREAAAHAERSDSPLARVEALSCLGHHLVGLDMADGMATLEEARRVAERYTEADIPPADRPLFRVQAARLHGHVGVAAFDDGRFDEAEESLRRSITALEAAHARDQFAMISNYLGQLLTATGRFEEAEQVLQEALRILREDADLSVHQGYNQGLLGKLYLEWGRPDEARPVIDAGYERVLRAGHASIVPILRIYLAEVLTTPGHRDLERARRLCDETVQECRRTGFRRSLVGALSLGALVNLQRGEIDEALNSSSVAVSLLEEAGTMPALRSEEVYYVHHQVLQQCGKDEARHWLERARAIVAAKAASLSSPDSFLTRVPINRAIGSA